MTPAEQRALNKTMELMTEAQRQLVLVLDELHALRDVASIAQQLLDYDPAGTYRDVSSQQSIRDALHDAIVRADGLREKR